MRFGENAGKSPTPGGAVRLKNGSIMLAILFLALYVPMTIGIAAGIPERIKNFSTLYPSLYTAVSFLVCPVIAWHAELFRRKFWRVYALVMLVLTFVVAAWNVYRVIRWDIVGLPAEFLLRADFLLAFGVGLAVSLIYYLAVSLLLSGTLRLSPSKLPILVTSVLVLFFSFHRAVMGSAFAEQEKVLSEQRETGVTPLLGKPAPLFELASLDGSVVGLETLKGNVVVIDFWATWCLACKFALPHLDRIHREYRDRDVRVLTILASDRPDNARRFLKEHQYSFPVLLGTEQIYRDYLVHAIPALFVLDREGIVKYGTVDFAGGDEDVLYERIEELLQTAAQ